MYNIVEVSYVEPSGESGIALACGESSDSYMLKCDLQTHGFGGRMWYFNLDEAMRMPVVAEVVVHDDSTLLEQLQHAQKHRLMPNSCLAMLISSNIIVSNFITMGLRHLQLSNPDRMCTLLQDTSNFAIWLIEKRVIDTVLNACIRGENVSIYRRDFK